MKIFSRAFGVLLVALLTGCVGISSLPVQDTAYFRYQVETALANDHCIKELFLLNQNGKRIAIITLISAPGNAEGDCLKAMHSLSRDPQVPVVDSINIKAVCSAGTRRTETSIPQAPAQMLDRNLHSYTMPLPDLKVVSNETAYTTLFSCVITRDALLKGDEPQVVIRDGIFVSGPNKGEAVTF